MSKDFSKVLEEGLENLSESDLQEVADQIDTESFVELDEEIQEALKLLMSEERLEEMTTAAADTLRPKGAPGQSKAEMLSTFTSLMAQLGKEDLSMWMDKALEQSKKSADGVPSGNAAKNKMSIDAKKTTMKENVEEMFSADKNLSEDFKEKASTILEAVINTEITQEKVRLAEENEEFQEQLEEQYIEALQEEANEIFENLTDQIDVYLDYVVENWMKENEVAIESTVRTELAENFIKGMHTLFTENYVTVPDSEIDIVSEMKEKIDSLEAQLNETIDEKLSLEEMVDSVNREAILDEISEGLAETQVEKLRTLSEGVEYTDEETYYKKLNILKENFFSRPTESRSTGLITEEIDGSNLEEDSRDSIVDENIAKYAAAISKSKK